MRQLNLISLTIMAAAALFTWNAVAEPIRDVASIPVKYHVMDNLSQSESKIARDLLKIRGYQISEKELFSESGKAVLITKTDAVDGEQASIQIDIVQMNLSQKDIPHTTFTTTIPSSQISEAIQLLPNPNRAPA
jgi:hypothetical protein